MFRFVLRRLALTVPVLIGVSTLVFLLIHLIPGDPVQAMLGDSALAAGHRHTSRAPRLESSALRAIRQLHDRHRGAATLAPRFGRIRR